MKTIILATHNQGKVLEFEDMFKDMDILFKSAREYDLPEPEETEKTFEGNALLKARAAFKATSLPSLADDSGLCVDALNGAPGIYSARWGETAQGRDFNIAMARVNKEIGGIDTKEEKSQSAYFIAVLAYIDAQGNEHCFEGKMQGALTWPMRGTHGHGYDPIFVPEGFDITAAEMVETEKNKISHRAKAVAKFKDFMSQNV